MATIPGWSGPPITPRQQRTLFALVEWERVEENGEFMLVETNQGDFFIGHDDLKTTRSDVEQLVQKGYLHGYSPKGTLIASVTAEGHAYYEAHHGTQHPAEQLAEQVRAWVDTQAVANYPEVDGHLREAARRLWATWRDADVKDVGDKCRDAVQAFAQAYYSRFYPRASEEPVPTDSSLDAVSKVLRHLQATRGERDTAFADARRPSDQPCRETTKKSKAPT
jgi:hypothetical protein